ncbi:hypothetical protein A4S05_37470 [Nostoc sp. KVJ20]|uniref:hypothetical protein n=1 Tax=unclassified Nostoc TaxID=2593658 RepID=UPI00083D1559|nr:hypothetical protein [Nostoc sp. KVJ20]ODG99486.1 hypothetical protein A4S05_37470 [Nostoc sp. KVJ20]
MNLDIFIQELTATLKSGTEDDILKLMYFSDKTFEGFNNAGAGNLFKKMLLLPFIGFKDKDFQVTISEVEADLSESDRERFLKTLADQVQLECIANLTYQDEYKNISASAPIGKIGDTYKLVFF